MNSIVQLPGGNATNFALALATLGARVGFVGSVGRDSAARILREAYEAGGVTTRLRASSKTTGTTMAVTYEGGNRHLITAIGANADLRASDVPAPWIASTLHTHRAGYWWTPRLQGGPTLRLLRQAHVHGSTTSFDIATDPEGWKDSRREAVLGVLPAVDVFFGNEGEIREVGGGGGLAASADVLRRRGVQEVIAHLGSRGSAAFTADGSVRVRAFPISPQNPTGCGDVFNAAYVLGLLHGLRLEHRLRLANAAGAWHLGYPDMPYPRPTDLEREFGVAVPRSTLGPP